MVRGTGTLLNMATILIGSGIGVALRGRLPERTRTTVTDALGLVTLVIGGLNVASLSDPDFVRAVSAGATLLVVLGALLIGGIVGSLLSLEARLEATGAWLQRRLVRDSGGEARARFVEGYVSASLVFVVGPLAVLGSLSDGLGRGIEELALKATLDGFASLAFAASLGWGVAAAALSVGVVQGALTLLGYLLGGLVPLALVASITATGGRSPARRRAAAARGQVGPRRRHAAGARRRPGAHGRGAGAALSRGADPSGGASARVRRHRVRHLASCIDLMSGMPLTSAFVRSA